MICPHCRFENPENSSFCLECGGPLSLNCPQCGSALPSGVKFCNSCGCDLRKLTEASPIDFDHPQSYTPKFLADKILTTRSAIEGERKLVTVLFADVANYTAIAELLDPEEVHQIMNGCFKILMDEIHKFEGTINQFTGDGIMALFGAPVAHEDHAQRACYAALAIQKSLERFTVETEDTYRVRFKMRIGLNSGLVIVGSIGDNLRMDYTALGDTSNLASRIEKLASPGTSLVSKDTQKLARDFFEFKSLGKMEVKGKKEPQEIFELVKIGKVDTRIAASEAKGLTRFVGRKNSMATIIEAYEKAQAGLGQIVGIVGDAGVGKSRAILEFKNQLPPGKATCLEGHCLHFGSAMAYRPVLDILRSYFNIKEGDQEYLIREKLDEKIRRLDPRLTNVLPSFHELLSLEIYDEVYLKLSPAQKREKTFLAIKNLLVRESENRPIILVVEDLHWIDKTSEEFLDYLTEWLTTSNILLILLFRPEYTHTWGSKSCYNKISLDQLTRSSSIELIRAILDDGEAMPELTELIFTRAAGNPLYMEEFTNSLLENGAIQRRDQKWSLTKKTAEIQVPDTIQGIISARIDRLQGHLKQLMQMASVIGREFAYRILETISGVQEDLKSQLLHLQRLEFIYEKSVFPELEYLFKHILIQEVAYGSLLQQKRKIIHEKIGEAIENIYSERIEEFYEMLAYHYSQSDNLVKASIYMKLAGDKASKNHSVWEGVEFYKSALEVLNQFPDDTENKRSKLEVLNSLAVLLRLLVYPGDSPQLLQLGENLSRELGDEASLANFYSLLGHYHALQGELNLALRYQENCYQKGLALDDIEILAPIIYDLFTSYSFVGEWRKMVEISPNAIDLIEKMNREADFFGRPDNVYSEICAQHGLSLGMIGKLKEGEVYCEKSVQFAAELGDLRTLGCNEWLCGMFYHLKGSWKRAVERLESAIRHSEEANWLLVLGLAYTAIGSSYAWLEEPKLALDYIEKGITIKNEAGIKVIASFQYWMTSETYFQVGEPAKALKFAEMALTSSKQNGERQLEGISWILRGMLTGYNNLSNTDKAEEYLKKGLKILNALSIKPYHAIGYFYIGEFYFKTDQKGKASETLRNAEKMFKEMGMNFWLTKTTQVLDSLQ